MSWDYRALMSGRRRGPAAAVLRATLAAASLPYRAAVQQRNRRFDRRQREVHHCGVPVISVGNLTTGGTGKTPVVGLLARMLREQGRRVALVSRGYGRGENDVNDEAMELHARLPDVPHLQNPDRVKSAEIAVEELEAEVVLMDDGFQHRRLHRDLDIVVLDATCPFGYGYLLPRGLLREPLSSLCRADLVLISRADAVDADHLQQIQQTVRQYSDAPIVITVHRAASLLEFPDRRWDLENLKGQSVAAVSAIGNPAAFEQTLTQCGATVVATRRLPDHDPYQRDTIERLRHWIEAHGEVIDQVICTHKDLVKLQTDRLGGRDLRALMIDLEIVEGETFIQQAIERLWL